MFNVHIAGLHILKWMVYGLFPIGFPATYNTFNQHFAFTCLNRNKTVGEPLVHVGIINTLVSASSLTWVKTKFN